MLMEDYAATVVFFLHLAFLIMKMCYILPFCTRYTKYLLWTKNDAKHDTEPVWIDILELTTDLSICDLRGHLGELWKLHMTYP
jgi:hypothetical protein